MAINIYQYLLEKLSSQLDTEISDPKWFDTTLSSLRKEVDANLEDPIRHATNTAIDVLAVNKETIVSLGRYGLALVLLQISSGKTQDAVNTYIKTLSDPDDLIALMTSGADGVIKAKQKLDQMNAAALTLVKNIGIDVAKSLLPFLLSVI